MGRHIFVKNLVETNADLLIVYVPYLGLIIHNNDVGKHINGHIRFYTDGKIVIRIMRKFAESGFDIIIHSVIIPWPRSGKFFVCSYLPKIW